MYSYSDNDVALYQSYKIPTYLLKSLDNYARKYGVSQGQAFYECIDLDYFDKAEDWEIEDVNRRTLSRFDE